MSFNSNTTIKPNRYGLQEVRRYVDMHPFSKKRLEKLHTYIHILTRRRQYMNEHNLTLNCERFFLSCIGKSFFLYNLGWKILDNLTTFFWYLMVI